jgi:hypothetical protein
MKRLQSLFQPMVVSVLLMMGVGQIVRADCPVSLIIDPSETSLSMLNPQVNQFVLSYNHDPAGGKDYQSHLYSDELLPKNKTASNTLFFLNNVNAGTPDAQNESQLFWLQSEVTVNGHYEPTWINLGNLICGGLYLMKLQNSTTGICGASSNHKGYQIFHNCQATMTYIATVQSAQNQNPSVTMNVQNSTPHVILVSTPSSSGGHVSQVISPNQNQVFSLSSNYSQTTELFSVSGARIYASPFGDLADFDQSIGLTLTASDDPTTKVVTEPNALGLVQMQGQGVTVPVCDPSGQMTYDSLENCLHQVVQPQWYLWEVAPQNVIAECDNTVTQHIGAFCWHNTTTGEEFDVNIQDPPGTITATA